jgi:HPt (histidine-containing phosphotransfer) domain-containing protein
MPEEAQEAEENPGAQLAELRASFRPRLTARVEEIAAEWETVRPAATAPPGNPAPDLLRRLHRLAHSLAGTAGTFGFPAVGDAARNLERRLERVGSSPPPAEASEIESLVATLRRAAELPLL